MSKYHTYTIPQLVSLAADNDKEAVAELLMSRYHDSLVKVAHATNRELDQDDIDDALQNFVERNIVPDSKGQWRLRKLANEHNPEGYIATAFRNYLRDEYRRVKIDIVDRAPEEGRTAQAEGDIATPGSASQPEESYSPEDIHPKTQKELQIHAIFNAFERIDNLTPRERYILLTFLLGERYRGNGARPLKLRDVLSQQLDENPSTLYNRYANLLSMLRAHATDILRNIN